MPRLSANLGFLFQEVSFFDRFEAAARVGFRGVEHGFPLRSAARRHRCTSAGMRPRTGALQLAARRPGTG